MGEDDTIPLLKNKAARRATTRVASSEASGCLPGNCRAVSEQLPGNISRNTDECPRNGWRNCPEVSWQLPVKSTQQVTKQVAWQTRSIRVGVRLADTKRTGWRPRSSPRNNSRHVRQRIRAVSGSITGQLQRISRAVSGQHLVWRPANHPRSIK